MPNDERMRPIAEWSEGDSVQGFAFLPVREERRDRNGRVYLHLELLDQSGSITARVWPDSPALEGDYEARDFVAFEGTVHSYRDDLQLFVKECRPVTEEDRERGFDEGDLIPAAGESPESMLDRLAAHLEDSVGRPVLRRLARETLEAHRDALLVHPAAKTIHHAYRAGLLEHVLSMTELALELCRHYPELDRDLVLLGILFHDLGKIREIEPVPGVGYTTEGRLVGHVVIGRDMLRERCAAIPDFPEGLLLQLEHLVLSHQGRQEWGSPVEPMTAEGIALHFIDNLDSKMNQVLAAGRGGPGFHFLRPLGRHVYVGRNEESDDESS